MRTFSVKNFDRFQHYKDRSPPWIKLYNELLDDYAFSTLNDQTKFHLVAIWLLASRTENKIPHDPAWIASRINAKNRVDLDALEKAGFIVVSQDAPELPTGVGQNASKALDQRREEGESETEKNKLFDEWYAIYPRKQGRGQALKAFRTAIQKTTFPELVAGVERYKRMKPEYADWAMPASWLNGERWLDKPSESQKQAPASLAAVPIKSEREQWADLLARYKPGSFWPSSRGARPESGYCDAPEDLVNEWKQRQAERVAS